MWSRGEQVVIHAEVITTVYLVVVKDATGLGGRRKAAAILMATSHVYRAASRQIWTGSSSARQSKMEKDEHTRVVYYVNYSIRLLYVFVISFISTVNHKSVS